jgi:hypothetical protein
MRLKKNKFRRRYTDENKKRSFFAGQNAEEKSSFFSGNETLQRKLSVGKSDDPQEKEAEAAAKQVVNQPVQKAEKKEEEPVKKAEKKEEEPVKKAEKKEEEPVKKAEKKEEEPVKKAEKKEEEPVQKAEKKEEEPVQKAEKKEEEPVQKAEKNEEEPVQKAGKKQDEMPVQAKADPSVKMARGKEKKEPGESSSHAVLEEKLAKQKGRGFILPDDLRIEMEKKFHTNFREVRIHTDKEAEEMCEQIHALAFTHGHDIYFNAGQYNPNAASGKELLAHELAHVAQQNG